MNKTSNIENIAVYEEPVIKIFKFAVEDVLQQSGKSMSDGKKNAPSGNDDWELDF